VKNGKVESRSHGLLSETAVANGHFLACSTHVLNEDVVVEVPEQAGLDGDQFAERKKAMSEN
jgi:hypothetical protein